MKLLAVFSFPGGVEIRLPVVPCPWPDTPQDLDYDDNYNGIMERVGASLGAIYMYTTEDK